MSRSRGLRGFFGLERFGVCFRGCVMRLRDRKQRYWFEYVSNGERFSTLFGAGVPGRDIKRQLQTLISWGVTAIKLRRC